MNQTRTTEAPPTRAARMRWPLIIVAMLTCHVGALMYAVKLATAPAANGVDGGTIDPAYYERDARGVSLDRLPTDESTSKVR